jgi:hypothetical protein
MINFIVYAPYPFSDRWGGVIAQHTLSNTLAELGENAYIYAESTFQGNKAQLIHPSVELSYDPDNTVVIYPEAVKDDGNPLNSKYVVRWLLYTPGIWTPGIFPDTDLIFSYIDYYDVDKYNVRGPLTVLNPKLDIFYNKNLDRSGECYIIKKGKHKVLDKHSPNSINIDEYISDDYLVNLFNRKEYFVSYDTFTYHIQQAALCGCIPIVIPDAGVSKEEFIRRSPANTYGVAYGLDDIEYAKSTLHLVKPLLQDFQNKGVETVKNFIEYCYKHLNITKS